MRQMNPVDAAIEEQSAGKAPDAELQQTQRQTQQPVVQQPVVQQTQTQAEPQPGSYTPTQLYDRVTALYQPLLDYIPDNRDYSQQISDMYDKALAAQQAQLAASRDEAIRAYQAAGEKIPGVYQQQGNALAAQYERQKAAFNEQAAASGLNVGAGSQARLAQNAAYQNAYGQIAAGQANAQAEIEQAIAEQEAKYQSAIAQALADSDYQRAVALTQELKDYQSREAQLAQMYLSAAQTQIGAQTSALAADQESALERAKMLAGYGDFSGYEQLYGTEAADNMRALWAAQNPKLALTLGAIDQKEYQRLTGGGGSGSSGGTSWDFNTVLAKIAENPDYYFEIPDEEIKNYSEAQKEVLKKLFAEEAVQQPAVEQTVQQPERKTFWQNIWDGAQEYLKNENR